MTNPGNNPSNNSLNSSSLQNSDRLEELKVPLSEDAAAFMRSGLGKEVIPGHFILDKSLALVVAALRMVPDPEFLAKEAELADAANAHGRLSVDEIAKEVAALLDRVEAKIDTKRGVFYVGPYEAVRTNLLQLALPSLAQFANNSAHIEGAVSYVTQTGVGRRFNSAHIGLARII